MTLSVIFAKTRLRFESFADVKLDYLFTTCTDLFLRSFTQLPNLSISTHLQTTQLTNLFTTPQHTTSNDVFSQNKSRQIPKGQARRGAAI